MFNSPFVSDLDVALSLIPLRGKLCLHQHAMLIGLKHGEVNEVTRAIRKGGRGAHGFPYEVHALAMLASGGNDGLQTAKSAPECDPYVRFPSGITIRWSIKNHDQSDREHVFRQRCAELYAKYRARSRPGALELMFVLADHSLEAADFSQMGLGARCIATRRMEGDITGRALEREPDRRAGR